jgi:hypothetical protein
MKFRKRPVIIEAEQATEKTTIGTLEGEMTANPGDLIITGVKGERYPCKPDIFAMTYEPIESSGEKDCRCNIKWSNGSESCPYCGAVLKTGDNAEEHPVVVSGEDCWYRKSAPSPGPSVDVCNCCGIREKPEGGELIYADDGKLYHEFCIARIYEKVRGDTPPLPKEVEEAWNTIRLAIADGLWAMKNDRGIEVASHLKNKCEVALSVIKAAIRPKVVSREWVENQGLAIYRAEDQYDAKVLAGHMLRELGIIVEEKRPQGRE